MSHRVLFVAVGFVLVPVLLVGLSLGAEAQENPFGTDPFDDGPAPGAAEEKPAEAADPFGDSTAPATPAGDDPFGSAPAPPADNDPFGGGAPAEPADDDPFGTPARPASDDNPFGSGPSPQKTDPPQRPAEKAEKPTPKPKLDLRGGEDAILAELAERTSIDFVETQLDEVVDFLKAKHGIHVRIDRRALDDVGIASDTPITFTISNISLRSALELMLRDLDLTWIIANDVLLITTPEEAEEVMSVKTYEVADLLITTPDRKFDGRKLPGTLPRTAWWPSEGPTFSGMGVIGPDTSPSTQGQAVPGAGMFNVMGQMGMGGMCGDGFFPYDSSLGPPTAIDDLIDLICATIEPVTWDQVGGPGTCYPSGTLLVVRQTREVHEQIEKLLDKLRADRRAVPTVVLDARWLLLDSESLGRLVPDGLAVDGEVLEQLTREAPGFRGRLTCQSGQQVYLVAGDRRVVATGATPVVGSGIGYQPVIEIPNVGALLEVRPSVLLGGEAAMLDVQSTVTGWQEPGEPIEVGGDFAPYETTDPVTGEATQNPGGTASATVDRVHMPAQQLAATTRVPMGKPVLIGGLTLRPTEEADSDDGPKERKQLYLIIQTNVVP